MRWVLFRAVVVCLRALPRKFEGNNHGRFMKETDILSHRRALLLRHKAHASIVVRSRVVNKDY